MAGLGSKPVAEELRNKCKVIKTIGSLQILEIPLKKDKLNIPGCAWFTYGEDSMKRNCTIMVMGATGVGKSTLINAMINYILGVQWTDPYRFKLVVEKERSQTESQTSKVTVYKINHDDRFDIDFSLTIIDTPGFGDTRGLQRDKQITEQIQNLFTHKSGVKDIHMICFVVQSSLVGLTPTQCYVFESILFVFGKNVAENIRIMATCSDGSKPSVLDAIKAAKVPCPADSSGQPAHFKFNNGALFTPQEESSEMSFDFYWDMVQRNLRSLFTDLGQIEPKSLRLTKEVLEERRKLEQNVEFLQRKVDVAIAKIKEIKQTCEQIENHKVDIEKNKNFEMTVTEMKPFQEDISGTGIFLTNCLVCHVTCHQDCPLADDRDKYKCWAMDENRYNQNAKCRMCEGKCHWSQHFNQKYRWEYKEVSEIKTFENLKRKYNLAIKNKEDAEKCLVKLKTEKDELKEEIRRNMKEAVGHINKLNMIALKPTTLSVLEYIDLLIKFENNEKKSGWENRVNFLTKERKKTLIKEQAREVAESNDPMKLQETFHSFGFFS